MSQIFKLNQSDFVKGAITAVISAVVVALGSVVSAPDFNVFSVDWASVLNLAIKVAGSAFIGYISKNFFSDGEGKFVGKV